MPRAWKPNIPQGHVALYEAIEIAGSVSELARRVNRHIPCSPARIDQWIRRGNPIPPAIAPFIAHAVEDRVSVLRLCPEYERGWLLLREQLNPARKERRKAEA